MLPQVDSMHWQKRRERTFEKVGSSRWMNFWQSSKPGVMPAQSLNRKRLPAFHQPPFGNCLHLLPIEFQDLAFEGYDHQRGVNALAK